MPLNGIEIIWQVPLSSLQLSCACLLSRFFSLLSLLLLLSFLSLCLSFTPSSPFIVFLFNQNCVYFNPLESIFCPLRRTSQTFINLTRLLRRRKQSISAVNPSQTPDFTVALLASPPLVIMVKMKLVTYDE